MKLAALSAAAFALVLVAAAPPATVTAALADPARPAADRERDAARKPAELIAFSEVEPGDKVADFIMGGGYLTRVLAGVVGPKGRVYAYQPAEFIKYRAAYGEEQKAAVAGRANVTALSPSLAAVAFPEPLDAIVTVQNYHDLHLAAMPATYPATVNAALFKALKPGGVLVVVDHSAAAGSGFRDSDKLHRADPAAVRGEIEKAGFRFEAESPFLRATADPRTANVFDPAIRGKTDQFAYRFRKPV